MPNALDPKQEEFHVTLMTIYSVENEVYYVPNIRPLKGRLVVVVVYTSGPPRTTRPTVHTD